MSVYTEEILRWAAETSRAGTLPDADGIGEVGLDSGEAGSRLAVRFSVRVRAGVLEDVRFQVFGCGFTIAACAAAADLANGRPVDEAGALEAFHVDSVLGGLPPERAYCADLAIKALQAAIDSACGKVSDPPFTRIEVSPPEELMPRVDCNDPLYRYLMQSEAPPGISREDRHLFACLLAVAGQEPYGSAKSLGLDKDELCALVSTLFPEVDQSFLKASSGQAPPLHNDEILTIILNHVPQGGEAQTGRWLAQILAARAAHPGHLWIAMGLFERPQLTAAIARHLPSLAAANSRGMRWKRYLFRELCDQKGASLCKAPDCGMCSDHPLCFAPGE